MNNIHVLLLSSVLSIGSFVMGADSVSANAALPQKSFVFLETYLKSIREENRILHGIVCVEEEDINPLSEIKNWMVNIAKRNEYNVSTGQFHVLKEGTSDLIAPDHSLTVIGLKQYKPYILRLVLD
jgi:hypothetical protein